MRKQAVLIVVFLAWFGRAQAQEHAIYISAGPLLSIPTGFSRLDFDIKTGIGVEALADYRLSEKSSLLVQTNWSTHSAREPNWYYEKRRLSIFSFCGGYRYNLGPSGFFGNALTGSEKSSFYSSPSLVFRIGAGKRFPLAGGRLIDASVDYTFGDTHERVNVKALISLFQKT